MASDREQLLREYREYDAKVDIVSSFEVFFGESTGLPATIAHFERFPRYKAPDGREVTPDFTVLFTDRTLLVGEISSLAREERSLEDLLHQIGRYDILTQAPSGPLADGGHTLLDVEAADVLVLVPDGESSAAIDRIDQAIEERRYGYAPRRRPTVMGWSFDIAGSRYIFKYDDRSNNPRPRTHGREPSLTSWLQGAHDTLRCPAARFAPLKVRHRFMNDRPPGLYMATMARRAPGRRNPAGATGRPGGQRRRPGGLPARELRLGRHRRRQQRPGIPATRRACPPERQRLGDRAQGGSHLARRGARRAAAPPPRPSDRPCYRS